MNIQLFAQMAEKFQSGEFTGDMFGWWMVPNSDELVYNEVWNDVIGQSGEQLYASAGQLATKPGVHVCLFAAGCSIAKPELQVYSSEKASDNEYLWFGTDDLGKLAEEVFQMEWPQFDDVFMHGSWSDFWRNRYYENNQQTMIEICLLIVLTNGISFLDEDEEINLRLLEQLNANAGQL